MLNWSVWNRTVLMKYPTKVDMPQINKKTNKKQPTTWFLDLKKENSLILRNEYINKAN